jgi:hypothetical protein
MKWIKRTIAVGALFIVPMLLLTSPAGATSWVSPFNTLETYYMPGPPPGGYLSACAVTTENGAVGSTAISNIQGYYNSDSSCYFFQTSVVYNNGGPKAGPYLYSYYNGFAQSPAPGAYSDIGGNFNACNTADYCLSWSTTWIS